MAHGNIGIDSFDNGCSVSIVSVSDLRAESFMDQLKHGLALGTAFFAGSARSDITYI